MTSRDPRWIVLCEDGGTATIGRHREPDADDLKAVEESLARAGTAGWLAVQSQSANSRGVPEVIEVHALGKPSSTFEDALGRLLDRFLKAQEW